MILTEHSAVVSPQSESGHSRWGRLRRSVVRPQCHRVTETAWGMPPLFRALKFAGWAGLSYQWHQPHALVGRSRAPRWYIIRGQSLQSLRRRWWRVLVAKQMFCNAISRAKTYGGRESSKATRGWRTSVGWGCVWGCWFSCCVWRKTLLTI